MCKRIIWLFWLLGHIGKFIICGVSVLTIHNGDNNGNGNDDKERKSTQQSQEWAENSTKPFAVVGYLPEWRYEGANYDTLSKHLTHLLLFSLEPTSNGDIAALDRLPSPGVLSKILEAAKRHGTKVLVCFGGNGRSNGFSEMVRSAKARSNFVGKLVTLLQNHGLDGVDYNWEYPGYQFGRGWLSPQEVKADYQGLANLVAETRNAFSSEDTIITLAYYPDTRQEQLLLQYGIAKSVDLMHSMSYDQTGKRGRQHHSSTSYAKQTANQARDAGLPLHKVTLGLPFYGRYMDLGGDWVTYEDIVQDYHPLPANVDEVSTTARDGRQRRLGFNGRDTIQQKVWYAKELGLGGVMIWEAGQDCRVQAVKRHGQTHVVTCPHGEASSLLVAISQALLQNESQDNNNNHGTDDSIESPSSSQQAEAYQEL